MKIKRILDWLARELEIAKFDDVSNNGLQIAGPSDVTKVAFAVDASLESVKAAAACGAQLLVVHHGISWGGGIRRLTGGVYNVVKAAMESDAPLPPSRFLSALSEMPLRSDTTFCERLRYNLSRFNIEPMSTSKSSIFPITIRASF